MLGVELGQTIFKIFSGAGLMSAMALPTEHKGTYTCEDKFRLLFRRVSISIACASRVRTMSSYSWE